MSDVIWDITDVCLAGTPSPRLDRVTLQIHRGVTAVLGYSGAGKTSLLNLLVGFERPDRGQIRLTPAATPHRLPLYWVPQNDGLWPHLTAREHLEAVVGQPSPQSDPVLATLEAFDLGPKAASHPDQMSQGERSRLAVARALLTGAAVLVMDEPLVNVDPARVGKYWDVIRQSLARSNSSLVFSTHAPKAVLAEAQRAICLEEGRVLYEGPVDALYHDPSSEQLARCMGEANWLAGDEAALWLGTPGERPRCYRPERVALTSATESPIIVRAARFQGSVAEADLFHEKANVTRRFFHRPSGNHLAAGTRVVLKLIVALILAANLVACDKLSSGSSVPEIVVREEHYWSVPSEGPRVPAPRKMTIGKNNEVIVLDTAARVLVYSVIGELVRQWHMPLSTAGNPEGAILCKDGRIAVADTHYNRIMFFDQQGKVLQTIGTYGKGDGQFIFPVTLVQDPSENIYVCEYGGNDRVQKFDKEGKFVLSFGSCGTAPGQFQRPSGLVWHEGKIYVADATNNRLQVFTDQGKFLNIVGAGLPTLDMRFPYDLCLAPDHTLYVVEWGAGRISHITLEGALLGRYGSPGIGEHQFRTPWGVAIDPGKHIIVADTGNRRVVELKL